ncbi:hypothetical protein GIB67_038572 [Kingdonia uniflora]|uniref:RNase H type-1 domain-containing protein n=1 Tax=Kingdonia uniflora TaxID=39325 RepID=A0A7J7NPG3_9MAGN|nr:hypothetical protein GIB67_038572 [Kingdonia uniflora]
MARRFTTAPRVRSCRWVLPWYEKIKASCDSSSLGNPGTGGLSDVFRDHEGIVLAASSKRIGNIASYMAECQAVVEALSEAKERGWSRI